MPPYPTWANLVLYQTLWFIAVLGREQWAWSLPILLAVHLYLCRDRRRELLIMAVGSLVGSAVDCVLTLSGVFVFSPSPVFLPIPLWLVAIWLSFTGTLRHALAYLVARAVLFVLLAGTLAPLSYLAAAKLGAVELPYGLLDTYLILAPVWALITLALVAICRRIDGDSEQNADSKVGNSDPSD